jgi:RimJ/RimL family protein N-acetyltransferase
MPAFAPVTLAGRFVRLEPLQLEHLPGLQEAVLDGDVHRLWYTQVPAPDAMEAEIRSRLARQEAGTMVPFATRRLSDGRIIGMTAYCNIDAATPRLEIGHTWNSASAHGSGTNPDSKLLLLAHAFDVLGCRAVEFRTHWMNFRSREAIARLGARQDGVLRNHLRMPDGTLRDTVVFSVLDTEWPAVRRGLQERLARRHRTAAGS